MASEQDATALLLAAGYRRVFSLVELELGDAARCRGHVGQHLVSRRLPLRGRHAFQPPRRIHRGACLLLTIPLHLCLSAV